MSATPEMPAPETTTFTLRSRRLHRRASGAAEIRSIPILCWSTSEKNYSLNLADPWWLVTLKVMNICTGECTVTTMLTSSLIRIVDPRMLLSGLIGQHFWFCDCVFLHRFVAALLTIGIMCGRRLIARRTWMVVVLCCCTRALLHVFVAPLSFCSPKTLRTLVITLAVESVARLSSMLRLCPDPRAKGSLCPGAPESPQPLPCFP